MSDATCSITDCERPVYVKMRGWCLPHYLRWYRHGDPEAGRRPYRSAKPQFGSATCSVSECDRSMHTLGYCRMHYERVHANGTPDLAPRATVEQRFWARVEKGDACWRWLGANDKKTGYGSFSQGGRTTSAHRLAYELTVGPVPAGLVLDHLCHNADSGCPGGRTCAHRSCVRPDHLEPVTQSINVLRGRRWSRTTH